MYYNNLTQNGEKVKIQEGEKNKSDQSSWQNKVKGKQASSKCKS